MFLVAQPKSGVTAWMALIVFGREMFVTSLRAFLEQHGRDFSAIWSGKVKMALQCLAVAASLLSMDARLAEVSAFILTRDIVLWATVAITIYSGVEYTYRAYRMLRA
ncbi:MAG: CDP-diacylglycerol--glycerol-3-phosphate 3-phosphatidyltransferase [Planctomycetota bacterium]|nr:MAG: CDP-diacylglycerol--glycerol-3-phosphate 3-phosphatidyltransferase [Planctomycetota bacterium]